MLNVGDVGVGVGEVVIFYGVAVGVVGRVADVGVVLFTMLALLLMLVMLPLPLSKMLMVVSLFMLLVLLLLFV